MTTQIYWFSGTGNSIAVARTLAAGLGAELTAVADAVRHPPEAADRIGIVCPVYAFGPPALVEELVGRLEAPAGTSVFAVFTCACTAGGSVGFLRRMLRKRGLDLDAAWTVKMPENYPPLGGTPGPRSQRRVQAAAAEKTERILAALRGEPSGTSDRAALLWRIAARWVYPAFRWFLRHGIDRFFRADASCNGCGLCARICPVGNIKMVDGRPEWQGHCEQCFACFHWCPQSAVQYGFSSRLRRYHHPQASVSDFDR